MKTSLCATARYSVLALAASLVLIPRDSALADEKIAIDQLPESVIAAIKYRFPNAEFLSAERDFDDGKAEYEVKIRTAGQKKEVDVSAGGEITDVDDED